MSNILVLRRTTASFSSLKERKEILGNFQSLVKTLSTCGMWPILNVGVEGYGKRAGWAGKAQLTA